MKTLRQLLFLGLATSLVFTSCSVEKRVYQSGYNVEWKIFAKKAEKQKPTTGTTLAANVNSTKASQDKNVANAIELEQSPMDAPANENGYATETASINNAPTVPVTSSSKVQVNNSKTVDVENFTTVGTGKIVKAKVKMAKKAIKSEKSSGGGKSQLIALVLCGVVGYLGIHRFYLGYMGIGVIQLLTLGGCGIWTLIDFIMIITGDLQPKDGRYSETL